MTTDFSGGDIGDRSTFSNSANPMTSPEEVLNGWITDIQRFRNFTTSKRGRKVGEPANHFEITLNRVEVAYETLQSILAMPKPQVHEQDKRNEYVLAVQDGYNQCLADQRALIEKGVGK